jgi:hypothetical protein
MKVISICVLIIALLFVTSAAFAMGGGGSRGDGRQDFAKGSPSFQTSSNTSSGRWEPSDNRDPSHKDPADPSCPPSPTPGTAVPEPMTILLLGLGFIGVTAVARKHKS